MKTYNINNPYLAFFLLLTIGIQLDGWSTEIPQCNIDDSESLRLYYVDDLTFVRNAPWGRNEGKVYATKSGARLYVKERHLKGNFDSLLVSYFMSKLGQKICPGQIVKIVPVVDRDILKIGSFEVPEYISRSHENTYNRALLLLTLDLMDITDIGRGNVGHLRDNNLAFAVDVDLLGFSQREWLHQISDAYPFMSDEHREALKKISSISDQELTEILNNAEVELISMTPQQHQEVLRNPVTVWLKNKIFQRKQQMEWFYKNFEALSVIVNDKKNEIPLKNFLDHDARRSDTYGFFLHLAIERNDDEMIQFMCEKNEVELSSAQVIIRAAQKEDISLLKTLKKHCMKGPFAYHLDKTFEIKIEELEKRN